MLRRDKKYEKGDANGCAGEDWTMKRWIEYVDEDSSLKDLAVFIQLKIE